MLKSDLQLQHDVETELRWDPQVNAAQIGVTVDKGAVSLFGVVDSYAEKWAAEEATQRVDGVCTVAQDLMVKVVGEHKRVDAEIAKYIQAALKWNVQVPESVTATVEKGLVTLSGRDAWNYQRECAERAVRFISGVVKVYNAITLDAQPTLERVTERVEAALRRHATEEARSIHVATSGGHVTLTGTASSRHAIKEAANAAWAAPGVTEVRNQVTLSMPNP